MQLADYVDLRRYPIDATTSEKTFAAQCRERFRRDGVLTLPGFLTSVGLERLAREANEASVHAFRREKSHNVYLVADDLSVGNTHPARRRVLTQTSTVADDRIAQDSVLRQIYRCTALTEFLARVLAKPKLFPFADPLASLNIGVTETHQQLNWHFDDAPFATTLLLQSSESGGEFEYVADLRGRDDEHERINAIVDGDRRGITTLALAPGTLVLFAGHNALHRVAPVTGQRMRLMAILSYADKPGVELDAHTRKTFYGRAS